MEFSCSDQENRLRRSVTAVNFLWTQSVFEITIFFKVFLFTCADTMHTQFRLARVSLFLAREKEERISEEYPPCSLFYATSSQCCPTIRKYSQRILLLPEMKK